MKSSVGLYGRNRATRILFGAPAQLGIKMLFARRVWFPQQCSLFQISRLVGDQGERFGDGLRENRIHHEFLAVRGNGVGSARTAHGGGFEQRVERAQLKAGAFVGNVQSHDLLAKGKTIATSRLPSKKVLPG
jgi:hypothetical protein